MTWTLWLTVVSICVLGAMSPGPSLAVVLKQTLTGGRKNGLTAAITHGLGIGLYALLCISGIAVAITTSPLFFKALQWAGAAYLVWLGIKGFFIALFSQVIGSETSWLEKLAYAATALLIDMGWYVIVAWLFSNPRWLNRLQNHMVWMERLFGVILIALALRLLAGVLVA
jgi:threonine/homoserine/homoserine lactone efflux protein